MDRAVASTAKRWADARAALSARAATPATGAPWVLADDTHALILRLIDRLGVTRVVELGSGTSTVTLARAMRDTRVEQFVSVENDATHFAATKARLDREARNDRVQLVHAAITLRWINGYFGFGYGWHPRSGATPFDLAVIDGPRARTYGRFLTLPLLWRHLARGCMVVVDDAARPRLEGIWLRDWERLFGASVRVCVDGGYAKGVALLMKMDDSPAPPLPAATLAGACPLRAASCRRSGSDGVARDGASKLTASA